MTPVVALSRVHGRDAQGPEGSALGVLNNVSCMLENGLHVFVGAPRDGTAALIDLVSGLVHPRIGAVRVGGRNPATSPAIRRRIGALPLRPSLPPLGSVAATARRLGLSGEALAAVGAASLAERPVASLGPDEARRVALAFALGRPNPLALVLHDPLSLVPASDGAVVRSRLEALSADACVIVTTANLSELEGLSARVYLLDAGEILGDDGGWPRGAAPEIVVWLDGLAAARELVARLAGIETIERAAFDGARVVVAASSLSEAGRAVAAASHGLSVVSLRHELPGHHALVAEARRRLEEQHAAARIATMTWPAGPEEPR